MAAISSGLPSRPIGWRSMKAWRTLSIGSPLDLLRVSIRPSSEGLSIGAGTDGVAAHALADEVRRDGFGQADDGGLGGAVNVAVGDAAHRGRAGRDIDDRAVAPLQHARQEGVDGRCIDLTLRSNEKSQSASSRRGRCRDGRSRRS